MRLRLTRLAACLLAVIAVSQVAADEDVSLVIDPFTGAASLRNDSGTPIELDGYFITSPAQPVLDPSAWTGIEPGDGWSQTSSDANNRLGELNLFGSLTIPADGSIAIGSPYSPFAPATIGDEAPGLSSIDFSYTLANQGLTISGDVEFISRNTVVLVVDPTSGAASLENQSGFDVELDGYIVKSVTNALSAESWTPLSAGDTGWASSTGGANRIAEGNLFGSTTLTGNGGALALGSPVDASILNDEADLILEFSALGLETLTGGVLFRSGGGGGGGDTCESIAEARIPGDADGSGDVGFLDFLALANNFGTEGGFAEGNFDCAGTVSFLDFLTLANNFGSDGVAAAAVPEPNSLMLGMSSLAVTLLVRRRRK